MTSTYIVRRSFVLLVLAGCTRVFGQEAPVTIIGTRPPASALNLELVSPTATRLGTPLLDTPTSVEVVDQLTLQARGKRTSVEALEGVTGITASPRPGASAAMQGRGFAENSFGILYDGIRVGSTTATMRTYDSFAFDRVEVLRGAAGLTQGEGSVGGAINYVRKTPSRTAQPFELLVSAGSNEAWRAGAGVGGPLSETWSGRLDAIHNEFDGDVNGNTNEHDHVVASARADWTPTLAMTFGVDALRSSVDDAYWGTPLVAGALDERLRDVNYNNLTDNVHDDDVTWFTWKTDWRASESVSVANTAWHYQADRDWKNAYRFQYVAATPTSTAQVRRQWFEDLAYDHEFYGNRTDARWSGTLFGLPWRTAGGVEIANTDFASPRGASTGTPQLVDALDPQPASFFTGNALGRNRLVEVDQTQWSVFVEAQVTIAPRLSLVGGLRHDELEFDYRDTRPTGITAYDKRFAPTTGRFAVLFEPTVDSSAYVQYATGTESRFAAFFLSPADIPFDLTRARQIEAGWKQRFASGRGAWTAAAYEIKKDRIPFTDSETRLTSAVGEQSARGLELSAAYVPLAQLTIEANGAFIDAEYDRYATADAAFDGRTPPNVPERIANLGATWSIVPAWRVGGWLRHVGAFHANDANTVELPSATTLELFAAWQPTRKLDVTARVRNVTDRFYASWATDANYVIVAPERSTELMVRAWF